MENENQDNGPIDNTVTQTEGSSTLTSNNISDKIRDILFGEQQEEQQPEGSEQTGEVQTDDKVESGSEEFNSSEEETDYPQAEDGEDQVLSQTTQESLEDENLPNGVQKRINKLTARNKTYEEKISLMESKLTELEQKIATDSQVQSEPERAVSENPFSNLDDMKKIQAEAENARWLRFKCEENPDGFQLGESFLSAEEVRTVKVNALRALEEHLPKQVQYIKAHEDFKQVAAKEYPWYEKPETKEYKMSQEVLKNFPQFRNYPDFQLFVGDYVRGYMNRTDKRTVPQAAKQAPSLQVRPRTSPSQATTKASNDRGTVERFVKSGGKEGLAKLLLQKGFI